MSAAPTIFGAVELLADITADLALRGVVVDELSVGLWRTELNSGPSRVVVGVGKGSYQSAADTFHSTDGFIDVGNGQVARAILARVWTFPIWVHDIAPIGTAPDQEALAQMTATVRLADQVAAACARSRGGLPMLPWATEVLAEERGEFVYGGAVRVDVQIAIPVFDDPSDLANATQATGAAALNLDGTLTPTPPEPVT